MSVIHITDAQKALWAEEDRLCRVADAQDDLKAINEYIRTMRDEIASGPVLNTNHADPRQRAHFADLVAHFLSVLYMQETVKALETIRSDGAYHA